VQEVLEELIDRCTICAMLDKEASKEWRLYKTIQCRAHQEVRGVNIDKFRKLVVDRGGSYSYRRCWVN
jgi:hypothetical protein